MAEWDVMKKCRSRLRLRMTSREIVRLSPAIRKLRFPGCEIAKSNRRILRLRPQDDKLGALEDLDRGGIAGGGRKLLVTRDQGSPQLLGERHVCRIVGAQILSQPPDPMEQQYGSIARDAKRGRSSTASSARLVDNAPSRTRRRRTWANSTSSRCTVCRVSARA